MHGIAPQPAVDCHFSHSNRKPAASQVASVSFMQLCSAFKTKAYTQYTRQHPSGSSFCNSKIIYVTKILRQPPVQVNETTAKTTAEVAASLGVCWRS